jgi:hypothetical protein
VLSKHGLQFRQHPWPHLKGGRDQRKYTGAASDRVIGPENSVFYGSVLPQRRHPRPCQQAASRCVLSQRAKPEGNATPSCLRQAQIRRTREEKLWKLGIHAASVGPLLRRRVRPATRKGSSLSNCSRQSGRRTLDRSGLSELRLNALWGAAASRSSTYGEPATMGQAHHSSDLLKRRSSSRGKKNSGIYTASVGPTLHQRVGPVAKKEPRRWRSLGHAG